MTKHGIKVFIGWDIGISFGYSVLDAVSRGMRYHPKDYSDVPPGFSPVGPSTSTVVGLAVGETIGIMWCGVLAALVVVGAIAVYRTWRAKPAAPATVPTVNGE
ncbi:MAG: hypothetical protein EPN53_06380 [Acidobacteria bacterium]|nr:MAG: hypothetical protein EPN53_06380 [Acidobacteriota bacterium]